MTNSIEDKRKGAEKNRTNSLERSKVVVDMIQDGATHAEIAAELGVKETSVRTIVQRSRKRLGVTATGVLLCVALLGALSGCSDQGGPDVACERFVASSTTFTDLTVQVIALADEGTQALINDDTYALPGISARLDAITPKMTEARKAYDTDKAACQAELDSQR